MPASASPKEFNLINRLIGLMVGLVVVLGVANLVGTNALATQGVVLNNILGQTEIVVKENQALGVQIGKLANLTQIQSAARRLGFSRIRSNLIISGSDSVAAVVQR